MSSKSDVNIAIIGSGAMGSLFAGYLSSVANVFLFGNWPEQIEALQQQRLTIIQPSGDHQLIQLNATNDLAGMPPVDFALILVKGFQTARAARQAANIIRAQGLALTLQNGLGNLEKLAEAVGQERAALGITAQGATVIGPGRLRHAGTGATYLGGNPNQLEKLRQLAGLLTAAGLETTLADHVDSLVWGKLAINAGINPLTALLEIPNGVLAENDRLRQVMSAAATEVARVAAAQGIDLPFADAAARTVEVSRATATNRSSMLQDISRRAPTEINTITGEVVRIGKQLGIPTPVNQLLLDLVRAKEKGRAVDLRQLQLANLALASRT
jgi:2-dehydropantoate 2-reductase